jgi:hypothetical protein
MPWRTATSTAKRPKRITIEMFDAIHDNIAIRADVQAGNLDGRGEAALQSGASQHA